MLAGPPLQERPDFGGEIFWKMHPSFFAAVSALGLICGADQIRSVWLEFDLEILKPSAVTFPIRADVIVAVGKLWPATDSLHDPKPRSGRFYELMFNHRW
jgi:hypothetical protein